ncbi:hypothetical protein DFH09DRAFT_1085926 [Mycena vulgaris]|nr:hypothetical protein DFH09DRAFT_1085926 [Mycena vulgaris]
MRAIFLLNCVAQQRTQLLKDPDSAGTVRLRGRVRTQPLNGKIPDQPQSPESSGGESERSFNTLSVGKVRQAWEKLSASAASQAEEASELIKSDNKLLLSDSSQRTAPVLRLRLRHIGRLAMTTSSDVWTTGGKSYADYFREPRAEPPDDMVASESLNPHEPYSMAESTNTLTVFDPSALSHTLAVCRPAANAVNAVRDKLYRRANVTVPANGHSRVDKVNNTPGGGAADIIHRWSQDVKCTPHEFKRDKVLRVHGESALNFLVQQAGAVINETITTNTGHAIICTQEQYAMLRLTDALQLEISPVYATRGSIAQATDAAMLVLFYTHAVLGAGKRYVDAPARGITAMRVTLPAFPTWVFQPHEGVFRGGIIGRTKLISKSRASFFPLPWVRFDGDVQSSSNNVSITYGRLIFLFVASRGLIANTAHGPTASQRRIREYNAYAAMRTSSLPSWNCLTVTLRLTLFHRLVRLHKIGVQHNDLEPRNVTQSSSGPLIIDFDRASLDHTCPGASCRELQKVAKALDLDPAAEIETLAEETAATPTIYSIVLAFLSVVVVSILFGPTRFSDQIVRIRTENRAQSDLVAGAMFFGGDFPFGPLTLAAQKGNLDLMLQGNSFLQGCLRGPVREHQLNVLVG